MVLCAVATLIEYTIESPEQSSPIGSMRFKMEHSRILATSDWRYGYDVYSPHSTSKRNRSVVTDADFLSATKSLGDTVFSPRT